MKKKKIKFNLAINEGDTILIKDLLLIKGGGVTNPATCNPTKEKNPECCTNDNCPVNNNAGCACEVNNKVSCGYYLKF